MTNKFYLLSFSSILLLIISGIELFLSKKISIRISKIHLFKLLFLGAIFLSILISSPNKIQAFLNPNFGFITILSLIIFTYFLQKSTIVIFDFLSFSGLVLSAVTIFFFFQPFRSLALPVELEFLKNQFFTPLGNQLDLAIFLGFLLVTAIIQLFFSQHNWKRFNFPVVYHLLVFFSTLAALIITFFTLRANGGSREVSAQLIPFKYAWFGFTEILKNPLTALFGVGIDNLSYVFSRVRDVAFNLSPLWQIKSFDLAPSTLLQIAIESGLLGLATIIYLLYSAYKNSLKGHRLLLLPLIYLTLVLIFFPPSLTVFSLLFIGLTIFEEDTSNSKIQETRYKQISNNNDQVSNLFDKLSLGSWNFFGKLVGWNLVISISLFIFSLFGFYLLSRSYLAEFYFKRSADNLAKSQGKLLYRSQRDAISTNPYIERFHINFSQTNLLLATTLAKNESQITKNKSAIIQAGQIALIESKNAIALNPQKSGNWENLGIISRNLINVFNDADKEAITAYEQAILLDPQNPILRFTLGTLYYVQKDFSQSVKLLEQAVVLKPDWSKARYTYAWALYQNQLPNLALKEMETVLSQLDPKKDKADYEKAKEDLESMKEKIQAPPPSYPQNIVPESELILPAPPAATLEPKLNLPGADLYPPQEATPEAE